MNFGDIMVVHDGSYSMTSYSGGEWEHEIGSALRGMASRSRSKDRDATKWVVLATDCTGLPVNDDYGQGAVNDTLLADISDPSRLLCIDGRFLRQHPNHVDVELNIKVTNKTITITRK